MTEAKQRLIKTFSKNSTELVKVHVREWQGQTYFDIRVWHQPAPGEPGAEIPTKKGITLHMDLLQELQKALEYIAEYREKTPDSAQEGLSHRD